MLAWEIWIMWHGLAVNSIFVLNNGIMFICMSGRLVCWYSLEIGKEVGDMVTAESLDLLLLTPESFGGILLICPLCSDPCLLKLVPKCMCSLDVCICTNVWGCWLMQYLIYFLVLELIVFSCMAAFYQ